MAGVVGAVSMGVGAEQAEAAGAGGGTDESGDAAGVGEVGEEAEEQGGRAAVAVVVAAAEGGGGEEAGPGLAGERRAEEERAVRGRDAEEDVLDDLERRQGQGGRSVHGLQGLWSSGGSGN